MVIENKNTAYAIACVVLIIAIFYTKGYSREIKKPSLQPIRSLPLVFESYTGEDVHPSVNSFFDPSADEWILRVYRKNDGKPIGLFAGYWENQNEEKRIRSPRYTSGDWKYYWIKTRPVVIGSAAIRLKEFLNERGNEKELVYYGYIVNGKIIGSEYHLRFLNMVDMLLHAKSNAAVFRVSVPVTDVFTLERAEAYEDEFIKVVLPLLLKYI